MAIVAYPPPQIEANVNYYLTKEQGGGDTVTQAGTAAERLKKHDSQLVTITDVRNVTEDFKLDRHGFQYVKHDLDISTAFKDKTAIETLAYQKTAEFLKNLTGATKVIPFSHVHRTCTVNETMEHARSIKLDEFVGKTSPAMYCHIDQSPLGAVQNLESNLSTEEATRLRKTRWAIVNVWRALKPVTREPLIVCDARSVHEDTDLHRCTALIPKAMAKVVSVPKGGGFEMWFVAANKQHRWYWKSRQEPDDLLLIKCFDTKTKDGTARFCPHSAVQTEFDHGPARESVEIRCFVFWEDQPID